MLPERRGTTSPSMPATTSFPTERRQRRMRRHDTGELHGLRNHRKSGAAGIEACCPTGEAGVEAFVPRRVGGSKACAAALLAHPPTHYEFLNRPSRPAAMMYR